MQPKTKTILFILLSFALGALAGGIYMNKYDGSHRSQREGSHADWRKAFAERLKLDELQRTKVDTLIEVYRVKMNHRRQAILAARDTLRLEIRKLLSVEQNKLYDDYIKEMEQREERVRSADAQKKE